MTLSDGHEAPTDLRQALRLATAAAHRRLDRLPEQRALLRPGLTLADYAAILAGFARAQARLEEDLARVAEARPAGFAPYRSRLPALRADLAGLRAAAAGPRRSRSGHGADAPRLTGSRGPVAPLDAAEAAGRYLGGRYVLDGATQGARVIAPRLARHLPEAAGSLAFWRLQLDEAPAWDALTVALAARPAEGRLARAAVAAAGEAFEAFHEALARVGLAGPTGGAPEGAP